MSNKPNENEIQRKREYRRKWREEHHDAVVAAQVRYWMKKARELERTGAIPANVEIRNEEERQ